MRYDAGMAKTHTIELDEAVAAALKERADARGLTVPDFLAELVREADDAGQIAELDRRWAAVTAGQTVASNDEVVRWLETWGTPAYKPWGNR